MHVTSFFDLQEIVSYLISFDQHGSWVSTDVPDR